PTVCDMDSLVPRLCLGTHRPRGSASRRPAAARGNGNTPAKPGRQSLPGSAFPDRAWERGDAEPPDGRSHAERGNEGLHQHLLQMRFRPGGPLLMQGTPVRAHGPPRRKVLDVHPPPRLRAAELLQIDVRHALAALRVNLGRPADGVQVDATVLLTSLQRLRP